MKLRSSRSGLYIYIRPSSATILRIIERILNLELLNGVRSGDRDPGAAKRSNLGDVGTVTEQIRAMLEVADVFARGQSLLLFVHLFRLHVLSVNLRFGVHRHGLSII